MAVGVAHRSDCRYQPSWHLWCRSTKDAGPASDDEPSASELPTDEPAVTGKRKSGTAGKKQSSASKEFDPFEEDMDDGIGDAAAAAKRRRHGA